MNWIIKFLGLKGSWKWACRQMDKGLAVRPARASGTVKYILDQEGQRRILWTFDKFLCTAHWENANIFLSDFEAIDWVLV